MAFSVSVRIRAGVCSSSIYQYTEITFFIMFQNVTENNIFKILMFEMYG